MDSNTAIGIVVTAIVSLFGLYGLIYNYFTKPLHDITNQLTRIVTRLESIIEVNSDIKKDVDTLYSKVNKLSERVSKIEPPHN